MKTLMEKSDVIDVRFGGWRGVNHRHRILEPQTPLFKFLLEFSGQIQ